MFLYSELCYGVFLSIRELIQITFSNSEYPTTLSPFLSLQSRNQKMTRKRYQSNTPGGTRLTSYRHLQGKYRHPTHLYLHGHTSEIKTCKSPVNFTSTSPESTTHRHAESWQMVHAVPHITHILSHKCRVTRKGFYLSQTQLPLSPRWPPKNTRYMLSLSNHVFSLRYIGRRLQPLLLAASPWPSESKYT